MKTNLPKIFFIVLSLFLLNLAEQAKSQTTDAYTATGTWVCPAGVTQATVECWGGGGAGGGEAATTVYGGGGGAGGAYARKLVTVVPGTTYTVTVGAGGAGANGAGATGGASWFNTTGTVYAQGGAGGAAPNGGTANGGVGSSASSIGDQVYRGGNGFNGSTTQGSPGGGGAGSTGNGGDAIGTAGGTGTANNGGNGGGRRTAENDGVAGSTYGGGGGGAFVPDGTNHAGGSGADGYVTITYTPCGLASLPYTESFESITAADQLPSCMTATNVGTKVRTYISNPGSYNRIPRTGTDFASFYYSCNDWIYTPGFSLTAGQTYCFSLWYITDGNSGWTTLEALYGNAQNSAAMTGTISGASVSGPTNTTYRQLSGTFTAPSTGTFYIGIHCVGNSSPWYLSIDDLSLSAGSIGAVTVTGGGTYCGSTTLSASGGTGGTIYWQNTTSGGTSTATASSSQVVSSSGTYYFRASDGSCWGAEGSATVTINSAISITSQPPDRNACTGGSRNFSVTATGSSPTYQWQYFNGLTWNNVVNGTPTGAVYTNATTSTLTVDQISVAGNYQYRCVVTNSCGSVTSNTGTFTINDRPSAVTVSGGGTYCGSATLSASGGTGGTIYWQGTTSGGTSEATASSSQVVTASGTYYFRPYNGICWGTEGSATVTILNAPSISSITATPTNICSGSNSQLQVTSGGSSVLADWTFTAASGAFASISTTGTAVATSVSAADFLGDTKTSVSIPIGFTFNYLGTGYTNIIAMSDGYISFNTSATSSLTNDLDASAATQRPLLAPLWDDLDGASGSGVARYITTGSAGSRVFTIEWTNWQWYYAATGSTISFQVKLYEATGVIEFIYRPESGTISSPSASIGITATGTGSGNFLSLDGAGASPGVSSTVETTTIAAKPASGQIYRFTPPALSYSWSPTTYLSSSTVSNPLATAVASSTTYTVTVSNGTCGTTASTSVIISPLSCGALTTNGAACVGTQTVQANPSGGGTPYTFTWTQDGGAMGGGSTPTKSTASGTHTYACTVTDACGSSCSSSLVVVTNPVPTISVQPSPSTILAGNTTTFSVTAGGTPTYQWQYGTTSTGPWSDVSNNTPAGVTYANQTTATMSVITSTSASASTSHYYRCVVTASSCSTNSNSALLTITQYCTSGATSTLDMDITNITFSTINNTSGDVSLVGTQGTAIGTAGRYSNFRGSSVPVPNITQGATVPLSVTIDGDAYSHRVDAYIDFNRDGDFGDAGEATAVFAYANPTLPNTTNVNINVPAGASIGATMLRIVCVEASATTNGCGTYTYGETEDYDIYIISSTPCSGTPTAGLASSSISTFCNSGLPVLTASGYTRATGISLQWQSSADGSSWSTIAGAITDYYAVSPAITQTTYYRLEVKCSGNVAYTNTVQVSNLAQSITGTNSPQTVVCNTAAGLTATASGGTISWYAAETGGTALATGTSYNPTVTANTTFYVTAGTGGSSGNVGKANSPLTDGYYGSTGTGLVFDALSAFTLTSVKVYVQTAGSAVSIQLRDNAGNALNTATFSSCPAGLQTLTLNFSVPVGTGFRLVSNNTTNLARDFSGTAWPYTLAGVCSITGGWLSSASTTYYFFYDWVVSSGCESSPRVPINVFVSGGVTAPVCSTTPSPATTATNICPISTQISWAASNTACRAATGYKLYFGTDAAATNIHNGTDIGFVTSYTFPSLSATTTYYWRIVPYNSAGDATCATIWSFTTQADPGNVCITSMGTGVVNVAALPYSSGAGTTAGAVNDLTTSNTVACGSTSYLTGEDRVFVFTPATTGSITITLTSSGTYTGLMLYDNCPLSATSCGATPGSCVASAYSSTGNKTMNACVTAGVTYYLVLDSYSSPANNPYSNLAISAPTGAGAPANDLPCNALPLIMGAVTNGDNSCAGYSSEPAVASCWTTGNRNTIWYTVTAPASGQISVRTTTGTLTDTQIGLYSGNCSGLIAVTGACNNDISGCGTSLSSSFTATGLTPGNVYYLAVDGAYDLQGGFTIQAIDPATMTFPVTPGQDCSATLPTCATIIDVANPGYSNTGSICDFSGVGNCTGGERASVWYTINILSSGTLMFDIIPTDYSGGTAGDETDYDFLVWKTGGSGTITTCAGITANSATGLVSCNYNYLGVTGCYTGGNSSVDAAFDAAYEAPINVAAGDQYLICVSNFTLSTAGFNLDYVSSGGTATINTAATPTNLLWTGSTSTNFLTFANWGGCTKPTCTINAFVMDNGPTRWPVVRAAGTDEAVQNMTMEAGTELTIDATRKLTVCGTLTNAGTINVNGTLEVKGHLSSTGTINFGAGATLIFSGAAAQTFNSATALTIPNLTINNTSGGVTFNGLTHVTIPSGGALTLTSGIVYTSANSLIIMDAGSTASSGSATSYVDGPMRKVGNTAFVFPLGNGSRWSRIGISAPTSSTTFQAQYFATTPANYTTLDGTQGAANLNHISTLEYWQLDRVAGTGNASVTLYWSNATLSQMLLCGTYADLSVAKWTGTAWTNLNPTGATITGTCGGAVAGTITTQAAVTSFSPFTFGSLKDRTLNPLPIELLSFDGKNRGKVNVLNWVTASETNNDFFIVEKSFNGESFEYFDKIKGAGNSTSELNYNLTDEKPYNNITYYRLKQVDFDGKLTYSKSISVKSSEIYDQSNVQFTPNPFTGEVNVKLLNMNSKKGTISVVDLLGNKYLTKEIVVEDPNNFSTTIDLSELPKGMYFMIYQSEDYTKFEKMIKN